MKRKSPKNHRRKKRAVANATAYAHWHTITLGNLTFQDSGDLYFYDQSSATSTINFPSGSFSGNGFIAGDVITISGAAESKESKKVHPARRRIPKRNNNGGWIITNVDSSSSITVEPVNSLATATKIANDRWTVEVTGCVV